MSGAPPSYDETFTGPGSGAGQYNNNGPPPAHTGANNDQKYASAQEEKQNLAQHQQQHQQQQQQPQHASGGGSGSKMQHSGEQRALKLFFAPSGNAIVTASDEKTPIYNFIDSRAPDEQEQIRRSEQAHEHQQRFQQQHPNYRGPQGQQQQQSQAGLQRQDHGDGSIPVPNDVQFAQEIAEQRKNPSWLSAPLNRSELWTLTVRRGGDRNGPVIALIKRHIVQKSAVGIEYADVKTGIEQHSHLLKRTYDFRWQGHTYTWSSTHRAPGTSRLDSGSYVCRDEQKNVLAYTTSEDDRCDGTLLFEERCVRDHALLDMVAITGFVMRDLDDARNNPVYMRQGYSSYGYGGGYGAYGGGYGGYGGGYMSPYAAGLGFYPIGFGMPLLL